MLQSRDLPVDVKFVVDNRQALIDRWKHYVVTHVNSHFFEKNTVVPESHLDEVFDQLVAALGSRLYLDLNATFDALVEQGPEFGVSLRDSQQFIFAFAQAVCDFYGETQKESPNFAAICKRLRAMALTLRGVYIERPAQGLADVLITQHRVIHERWVHEMALPIVSDRFSVIAPEDLEWFVSDSFDLYARVLRGEEDKEVQDPEDTDGRRTVLDVYLHRVVEFFEPKGFLISDMQKAIGHLPRIVAPHLVRHFGHNAAALRLATMALYDANVTIDRAFTEAYNERQMKNYYNEVSIMLHRIKNKLTSVPTTLQTILMIPDEEYQVAGDPLIVTVPEAHLFEEAASLRNAVISACQQVVAALPADIGEASPATADALAQHATNLTAACRALDEFTSQHEVELENIEFKLSAANTETVVELLNMAYEGGNLTTELAKELQLRQNELYQREPPKYTTLDIYQLCRGAFEESIVESQSKNLTYEFHGKDAGLLVFGFEAELKRPFAQIIENAIKYTPEGGAVTVGLDYTEDQIVFTVKDTGIGIPPGEEDIVFALCDRCTNAKEFNKNGTGTGLYNDRKIILHHNGDITVRSEGIGKGSTFTISLPIHRN